MELGAWNTGKATNASVTCSAPGAEFEFLNLDFFGALLGVCLIDETSVYSSSLDYKCIQCG